MEIEYILIIILPLLGILLGIMGKKLTCDEKDIYQKKIYFPLFKGVIIILFSFAIFTNNILWTFLASVFIMVFVWNL